MLETMRPLVRASQVRPATRSGFLASTYHHLAYLLRCSRKIVKLACFSAPLPFQEVPLKRELELPIHCIHLQSNKSAEKLR
jgi:hypothetical protein